MALKSARPLDLLSEKHSSIAKGWLASRDPQAGVVDNAWVAYFASADLTQWQVYHIRFESALLWDTEAHEERGNQWMSDMIFKCLAGPIGGSVHMSTLISSENSG